ncbi:MAG: FAD-dependent oxidoreductase [Nitrospirae bacterium]|nr:FAD-dependent oxidoreductase [Nitrospirota bacterium]
MAKENSRPTGTDVLIVGGGLAGITAALGLKNSGLKITLVEKEPHLGGRARSWNDKKTGDPVHIGPHIFMNKYPNMFRMMDLCGTRDRVVWQEPGHFITMVDGRKEISMVADRRLPAPFHFTWSLLADKSMPMSDVMTMVPVSLYALHLQEDDVRKLDNINASAFLRSFGVSEYAIQRFWSFACMAIMNVPIDLCSAGALLRFYCGLIGVADLDIGFADTGLSDLYVPQSESLMKKSGIRVLKGAEVKAFTGTASSATGALLEDGRQIRAQYIISALTPMALRQVSPREWIRSRRTFHELVHFHASPYYSTYIWFDRKLTKRKFWARAFNPNDLNCDFYDMSNINRGWEERNSVIMTNCIYCDRAMHMSDEEIVAEAVSELAEYLPEAAQAKVLHSVVNHIPMAIHCPYPGMEQRRPGTVSPVRNLFLAGDWIQTGLPSCMENACRTGWLAAEAVLKEIGRPEKLSVDLDQRELQGVARMINRMGRLLPVDPVASLLRSRDNKRQAFLN